MVPSIYGASQLSSNRLMRNIDDAKNDAAEFVLMQMFPPAAVDLNDFYNLDKLNPAAISSYPIQQHMNNNFNASNISNNSTTPLLQQAAAATAQPQLAATSTVPKSLTQNAISPTDPNKTIYQTNNINNNNNNSSMPPECTMQPMLAPQYIIDPTGMKILSGFYSFIIQ